MRIPKIAAFNNWVMPVRLIGLGIGILGFAPIFAAADAFGILVAFVGAIVWQCGTFLKLRSPVFRRLNSTLARDVMMTGRIAVPAWTKVVDVSWQGATTGTFFVTIQDGYESGIVLPWQIRRIAPDDARYLPIGQLARPISGVDAIRADDSLLSALNAMDRIRRDYVLVLDENERVAGIVTRDHLANGSTADSAQVDAPFWASIGARRSS